LCLAMMVQRELFNSRVSLEDGRYGENSFYADRLILLCFPSLSCSQIFGRNACSFVSVVLLFGVAMTTTSDFSNIC
jgi:hypothetical protein